MVRACQHETGRAAHTQQLRTGGHFEIAGTVNANEHDGRAQLAGGQCLHHRRPRRTALGLCLDAAQFGVRPSTSDDQSRSLQRAIDQASRTRGDRSAWWRIMRRRG
jgi:hypothetical protein